MKTYFAITEDRKFLKIGKSKNPESRVSELNTSSPLRVNLLKTIDKDIERMLHKYFQGARLNGEWFDYLKIKDQIDNLDFESIIAVTDNSPQFDEKYETIKNSLPECSIMEKSFLYWVFRLGYVEMGDKEIVLVYSRKDEICKKSGVELRSMHNSLYRLISKKIIIKDGNKLKVSSVISDENFNKLFELKIKYKLP